MVLVLHRRHLGGRNVVALRSLVTAHQQQHERGTALHAIQPVAGTVVDIELQKSAGEVAALAGIAFLESPIARNDARSSLPVPECSKPVAKPCRLANFDFWDM
jgi:hypothetical protein